ncbi:CPBP family intramembrane glutamic endopeptidase [Pasteuria penetrans]|uniref:CPBP family intramembrane glutamic endopeptidase n=1 Tax=Pasteuria penetrans TaxID=86005 RepID=UPI000FB26AFC|nr:CPBP family intramembrane glutamic endopeptidase [Pasteuria penetrans]
MSLIMSKYITINLLVRMLLETLLVLFVVRFDRVYYQHTVVLKNSSRRELLQRWGRMADVFLVVLYGVWTVYYAFKFMPVIKKWLSLEHFFYLPVPEQFSLCGLLILYSLLGVFFVWPAFRSYILSQLQLDPQRYLHRILVWWMFSCFIDLIFVKFSRPNIAYEYLDWIEDGQGVWLIHCQEILLVVLAIGGGVTRNWKEMLVRLGLNRKPTVIDLGWAWVSKTGCDFLQSTIHKFLFLYSFLPESSDPPLPSLDWPALMAVTLAPAIGEELFFRGALQPRVGIWITSILFTLVHAQYDWYGLLIIFLGSLLLGWIAHRYSIWLSIGFHMYNNFMVSFS